jgi:hypothetical protein
MTSHLLHHAGCARNRDDNKHGNVVPFPDRPAIHDKQLAWRQLTKSVFMEKFRRGELEPAVIEALLECAGLP